MEELVLREYIAIAFVYLIVLGIAQAFWAGIATLVTALVFRRCPWFRTAIKVIWIFAAMLLCTGILLNIIWTLTVFDHFYWVGDYAGFQCSPFGVILRDNSFGPVEFFYDMTKWHIRAFWLIYALLAWGSAILLTWAIIKLQGMHERRTMKE